MPPTPKAVRVRTDTGWEDISLTGPQGIQGIQGLPGIQGPQGPPGPFVEFKTTGPQYGDGVQVLGGSSYVDSSYSGRDLIYSPSPSFPTRALVQFSSRWDCQTGAWGWCMGGCEIDAIPGSFNDYGTKYGVGRSFRAAHSAVPG